jgi:SH3 domain-containing YSC84-like protein 1
MKRNLKLSVILVLVMALQAHADVSFSDADNEIGRCDKALKDISAIPGKHIPKDLFQKARGLAIFPGVINIGVLVGFESGKGIILRRDQKTLEWSNPAFFIFRSGSLGFQFGAQSIDLILLFMDEVSIQRLLEEKFILGVDASVSAGPVGRDKSMDSSLKLESQILSYARAKGLFLGVSVSGGVIQPDTQANEVFQGKNVSVQDVLYENRGPQTDNTRNLLTTIKELSK